jgi:hypothetical protein
MILGSLLIAHLVRYTYLYVQHCKQKKKDGIPIIPKNEWNVLYCILVLMLFVEICSRTKLSPISWIVSLPVAIMIIVSIVLHSLHHTQVD